MSDSECIDGEMMEYSKFLKVRRTSKFIKFEQDILEEFKKKLFQDKRLKIPEDEDTIYIRCLRARKYNIERALKLAYKFFSLKSNVSDIEDRFIPSLHADFYRKNFLMAGVKRDSNGRLVAIIQVGKWNPDEVTFDDVLASSFLFLDEALASVETQFQGIVAILDFQGFGFHHARHCGPVRLQQMAHVIQDSYPVRVKEIHVINHPMIFHMVFSIIKPFLKEKMRKRMTFHSRDLPNGLHKSIDPNLLPDTVKGNLTLDEFMDKSIPENLLQKDEYYKKMIQCGYSEE